MQGRCWGLSRKAEEPAAITTTPKWTVTNLGSDVVFFAPQVPGRSWSNEQGECRPGIGSLRNVPPEGGRQRFVPYRSGQIPSSRIVDCELWCSCPELLINSVGSRNPRLAPCGSQIEDQQSWLERSKETNFRLRTLEQPRLAGFVGEETGEFAAGDGEGIVTEFLKRHPAAFTQAGFGSSAVPAGEEAPECDAEPRDAVPNLRQQLRSGYFHARFRPQASGKFRRCDIAGCPFEAREVPQAGPAFFGMPPHQQKIGTTLNGDGSFDDRGDIRLARR